MKDRIESSFARQSMMQTLGATLAVIEKGRVVITAPILETCLQQHGFGHAGLTFAIGDSAAGYAALTLMPDDSEVLTAEMKINLLAPAAKGPLCAIGEVVKSGRRLVVVRAEVSDSENVIAILQGTMIPVVK